MNKQFITENKQVVKEFLGNLLVKIISGKINRDFKKKIENDPALRREKENFKKLEKKMLDRIKHLQKTDPDFENKLRKLGVEI
tara:strand:+ start:184 stop:432 length:249 start_codon:yes stop_codon:yes gene_type:complete